MHKRALITGGAQRLGAELVRAFAHSHWEVWCHFQHSKQQATELQAQLNSAGLLVHLIQADLAQQSEIEAMMAKIHSQGGALSALVNNASLF